MNKVTAKQLKDRAKEYKEWEYSPEGIHYRFGGLYGINDPQLESIFFTTLSKLPKEVVDLAEKTLFSWGDALTESYIIKSHSLKDFKAIVILYNSLRKKPLRKIEEIIAHEIAHVYLKHDWGFKHNLDRELEADELASKWLGHKITHYTNLVKKLNKSQHAVSKK